MGEDVGKWERLLQDMKRSRSTFDNTDSKHSFGPILVDYAEVQVCKNSTQHLPRVHVSRMLRRLSFVHLQLPPLVGQGQRSLRILALDHPVSFRQARGRCADRHVEEHQR